MGLFCIVWLYCLLLPLSKGYAQADDCHRPFEQEDLITYIRYVHNNHQPIDWPSLVDNSDRVIVIGELHDDLSVKEELVSHMQDIRKAGITHIALEALSTNFQYLLDAYQQNDKYADVVDSVLRRYWGWLPRAYMDVIQSAKKSKLKLVAIDQPPEQAVPFNYDQHDQYMADGLAQILEQEPASRILVLAGNLHAETGKLPTLLKSEGIKSTSYVFNDDRCGLFRFMAQEAGLDSKRFMLFLPPNNTLRFNGYIHIPSQ